MEESQTVKTDAGSEASCVPPDKTDAGSEASCVPPDKTDAGSEASCVLSVEKSRHDDDESGDEGGRTYGLKRNTLVSTPSENEDWIS